MASASNKKPAKSANIFLCESCDFKCSKHCDYNRHKLTRKHQKNTNSNDSARAGNEYFTPKTYNCEICKKVYKDSSGLWRHKKKCFSQNVHATVSDSTIMEIIKQNQEFKELIIEQTKKTNDLQNKLNELIHNPVTTTTTTTNTNINNNCNNNNRFNLNVFLNEKCKDAMNITDFVDSLKLTIRDLEKTAEIGYVRGITNIIMNGLNQLDICKRPIHCSDVKRETLYIKDNNIWEKENEEKKKITRAIKHISVKNAKQVGEWTRENKGYDVSTNKKSDKYLKIVSEANGGEPEEINKIISNISSKVIIDKVDV
jgi:hypothetical protein